MPASAIARMIAVVCVCSAAVHAAEPAAEQPYAARRLAFRTAIHEKPQARTPAPTPPRGVYELVTYPAPLGQNAAYVTPVRKGARRPAIVWIQGGFDWSLDDGAWQPAPRDNDQSARAFREAGMVELLPSLRGCNDNPGDKEYFLGEVDDVLAAVDFLRKRPDVDPARIYVGGHSTGATLALLVAASRPAIRAAFAFGPIDFVKRYGVPVLSDAPTPERLIRSPALFLHDANMPVYVIEGEQGNASSFDQLRQDARKVPVQFLLVKGATHFSTLAPITELIAKRLMAEASGGAAFSLSAEELAAAVAHE